ncbi:MAG: hypothetical protein J7K17_03855, partial [Candidatus Omnitrophica bacterium]|nr:hypothetical protein [Candidatus Omnitrophota bacterium]
MRKIAFVFCEERYSSSFKKFKKIKNLKKVPLKNLPEEDTSLIILDYNCLQKYPQFKTDKYP